MQELIRKKTGHEHPRWKTALKNYRKLQDAMNLPPEEIEKRMKDVERDSSEDEDEKG